MTAAVARRVEAPRRRTPLDRSSRAPSNAVKRPQLRAIPRPSTTANAMFALVGMIGVLMLAAVVLHTRLADRQLEIDRLQSEVTAAHERFDVLRQQRAELSSPNRIALEAQSMGMLSSTDSNFLELDAASFAEVVVAVGAGSTTAVFTRDDAPLDQLRRVREAAND